MEEAKVITEYLQKLNQVTYNNTIQINKNLVDYLAERIGYKGIFKNYDYMNNNDTITLPEDPADANICDGCE